MIGNDIVDLKQTSLKSNWKRKGFLDKVFTQKEQNYISTSPDSFKMVWQLWSMKESAYKINVQQYQNRFFNPKKIECTLVNISKGIVTIDKTQYFTTSEVNTDYIYTVAMLEETTTLNGNCFKINDTNYRTQHQMCYNQLKQAISQNNKIKKRLISIKKDALGVPKLYANNKSLNLDCSITHHGHYGAYIIREALN